MTDVSRQPDGPGTPPVSADESDEAISLKPLFRLLSNYRRVLALAVVVALTLWAAAVTGLAIVLPSERTGSLRFRLLFDGAADGLYPNGTTFSPAELVAVPVLSEVYRANDLQRFGLYEDFKDSMSVLRSSLAENLLAASYSARLADTRLTPVERARLEDEYRKKRDSIMDPVYTLSIRRHERLKAMPAALMEKTLNDTLATWAKQADELKGVMRFDVPVFSRHILKPDILDQDFLIAADGLRVQALRASNLAAKLLSMPGAASIRSRKDQASLSDVAFEINDTLRNKIGPLVYMIQERGLTRDPQAMAQYLRGRVVDLQLARDATRARIVALQNALQGYMANRGTFAREESAGTGKGGGPAQGLESQTLIPQLSDTFLDRIIEMSTQTQAADVEYRKELTDRIIEEGEALFELTQSTAYYEGIQKSLRVGSRLTPADVTEVSAQIRLAYDALVVAVGRLMDLYEELSAQRLNPAAALYEVADPFDVSTQRALPWRMIGLSLALTVLLTLLVAPIGCALHQSATRKARGVRAR
jgi:hypothetical protein